MKRPIAALRSRLRRIEEKPKPVYQSRWSDFAEIKKNPDLQNELLDIIESIERGHGVPEQHYRAGIDRDKDALLEEQGIMHLHLGGKHSDTLVFLIQYADQVVLLETNTHMHFRTQPAGKYILALSQSWLANLEHDLQQATGQMTSEADAKRARLAASIARFKKQSNLP